ncbi:MAG: hypothetical protein QGI05_00840, partial [Candidatus Omnitrophota bacterium]|nr:hypothetical protein [Candidatus Omnitrophota bacterium]
MGKTGNRVYGNIRHNNQLLVNANINPQNNNWTNRVSGTLGGNNYQVAYLPNYSEKNKRFPIYKTKVNVSYGANRLFLRRISANAYTDYYGYVSNEEYYGYLNPRSYTTGDNFYISTQLYNRRNGNSSGVYVR